MSLSRYNVPMIDASEEEIARDRDNA